MRGGVSLGGLLDLPGGVGEQQIGGLGRAAIGLGRIQAREVHVVAVLDAGLDDLLDDADANLVGADAALADLAAACAGAEFALLDHLRQLLLVELLPNTPTRNDLKLRAKLLADLQVANWLMGQERTIRYLESTLKFPFYVC